MNVDSLEKVVSKCKEPLKEHSLRSLDKTKLRFFRKMTKLTDRSTVDSQRKTSFNGTKPPFMIGVAGGTASGKSTVCKTLMEALGQNEMSNLEKQVVSLSQDSFYRELSPAEIARANKGMFNFDHPDAFDSELMESVLQVPFIICSLIFIQFHRTFCKEDQRRFRSTTLKPMREFLESLL